MSSYSGRHADLYDLFYAEKPYAAEAAFVDRCLHNFSDGPVNRLLEIACGTGTHAFHLEKPGRDIVASDYSEAMLRRAREKATEKHSRVEFQFQDMTKLDVGGGPFDAVICLFDAIGYVRTNDALSRVFQGVHKHLRPGGLFIFEFWHAAAMIRHYDPLRVRRWQTNDSEVLRISETSLDAANQTSEVKYSIYELKHNGTYSALTETQVNRYFLLREMEQWLSWYKFTPVKWFAGFTDDETITEETWHIVSVARRN